MPPGMPPIFPPPGMDHEGFQKWQAAVASFYEQHHGPGGMDPSGGPPPGFPPGLYMWQGQVGTRGRLAPDLPPLG